MRHLSSIHVTRTFLSVVLLPCLAFAQPKLNSVVPRSLQRGATVDVTLTGERLNSVTGFVFNGESGLTAQPVSAGKPAPSAIAVESASGAFTVSPSQPKTDEGKSLVIRVSASANAAVGARELRVMGPTGISAPIAISVTALAEIAEAEPNNTLEQAQTVALPATIVGAISKPTEIDQFRFKANKGEVFVFDVEAARRGSPLDSSLAIRDSKGTELVRSEDVNGLDSLISFNAPAAGEYIVELRDFEYRGGAEYRYRIHSGMLPYVASAFPFGLQRGKPTEIQVTGHNLGSETKMMLSVDDNAPVGRQEIRLRLPQGLSNPVAFDVQDLPEILEVETNATNVITVPMIANGRIEAAGDVDYFTFKAPADQRLVVEVAAQRFGSRLDALMLVYSGGSLVAQNDDAMGADARLELDVKKGAEYLIALRDLTSRGGAAFGYRLSVRPPQPSLAVKFFPDVARLNRNGSAKLRCEVTRSGFDAPVEIMAEGLPLGTIVEPLVIPAGVGSGTLIIHGSSAAPIGTGPMEIKATSMIAGHGVLQTAQPVIVDDKSERAVKQAFATVLEATPFTIEPVTLSATLDQGGATNLTFMARRENGFGGEIKVTLEGFSAGREPITKSIDVSPITLKPGESQAAFSLKAKTDSEIGTRHVFARAESIINGETVVQYSRPVPVTVAQIPFLISVVTPRAFLTLPAPGSTNPVEEVTVKFKADRRGYNDEIPLTLEGVPEGVTVVDAKVPAGSGEAAIRLTPTLKSKPGTNYSFKALGVATYSDRIYRHKSGSVKLFIEAPAVDLAATNSPITAQK